MAVSRFATSEELLDSAAREWGAGGREWGAGGKQPQGARAVAITVECSNASERCGFRVGPNVLCIHPSLQPCNGAKKLIKIILLFIYFMEKKWEIF